MFQCDFSERYNLANRFSKEQIKQLAQRSLEKEVVGTTPSLKSEFVIQKQIQPETGGAISLIFLFDANSLQNPKRKDGRYLHKMMCQFQQRANDIITTF